MNDVADYKPGLGDPWLEVVVDLRRSPPQFPTKKGLLTGLRSKTPVPEEVREFLAKLVSGEMKRPKGTPKQGWFEREIIGMHVRTTYEFIKELMAEEQQTGEQLGDKPSEIALIRTQDMLATEGEHRSVESIRDIILRRKGW